MVDDPAIDAIWLTGPNHARIENVEEIVAAVESGRGTLKGGRHIRNPKNTPMANLLLSMLDTMGIPSESFGDSTGRLTNI